MILPRTQSKLLKTVNGKPHATDDDHFSSDAAIAVPLPTPPDSAWQSRSKRKSSSRQAAAKIDRLGDKGPQSVEDEKQESDDPNRDPVSSEDEDMANKKGSLAGSASGFLTRKPNVPDRTSTPKPQFQGARPFIHKNLAEQVKKAEFCVSAVTSASVLTKRVADDAELDEDSDGPIFSSSQPKKKRSKSQNIHAPPRSSPVVFGRSQEKQSEKRRKAEENAQRKKEKKEKKNSDRLGANPGGETLPRPAFKRHNLSALRSDATAGAVNGGSAEDGASSPLSALSASPEPDLMAIVCETCHQRVDKLLKEEYNDSYVKGKSWNIQWQERFCEWHRTQTAKEEWQKRRYPDIDWTALERRMRQHDGFLLAVLRNQAKSQHRDEYVAKVRAKNMIRGFKDTAIKPGATVGYYGPKGEKAMSEHILSGLSDQIRQRAKTDRLVSPSGYQGGISGFVQAVMMPHLAELLIKEDMRCEGNDWETRVREFIGESAEIGELVHPEVADRIQVVEGEDDWVLQ